MYEQPVSTGLERRGGQRVPEIRLGERDHPQAGRPGVRAEPAEDKLIGRGQYDQRVGGAVPVSDDARMVDGEVECRVRHLNCLDTGRQIGTGHQVEARDGELAVWHDDQRTGAPQPAEPSVSARSRYPPPAWDRSWRTLLVSG